MKDNHFQVIRGVARFLCQIQKNENVIKTEYPTTALLNNFRLLHEHKNAR